MGGAYFAAAGIEPTMAIACDVTFATDYPGVNKNKHGDVTLGEDLFLQKGHQLTLRLIGCWKKQRRN